MNSTLESVTQILAIGSILSPVIFGFVLWKISQIFVSKTEFSDFKRGIEAEKKETKENMKQVNDNLIELLQRTAHLRESK